MAKENKNLRKLNPEETHNVAGGKVYYGRGRNCYFVPNPTRARNGKYYSTIQDATTARTRERAAGRSDEIIRFNTAAEAQAAAEEEGLLIAADNGDQNAINILFGTFNDS